ncbi:zinc-ribbon domain-containing protein [Lysinibacillus sp. KU-BSD001]|uniref:zinc-ribbon domain-containing protein n=1 Tax=Lysinibacillus sp. KU-BSD001 TaxID=3141328 RepID=UPI0036E0E6C5
MFFTEQSFILPLVWAQKVIIPSLKNPFYNREEYKREGEVLGPFRIPSEAAKALGIRNRTKVNEVLKGNKMSIQGYTFWYEGERTYSFKYPNIKAFKKEHSFEQVTKHTAQTLRENLQRVGFDVIKIYSIKGTETKIEVPCSGVVCKGTCKKIYKDLISDENPPYCKHCLPIIKSIVQMNNEGPSFLYEVRPDLERYYDQKENDNKPFSYWRKGSKTKIKLTCVECRCIQTEEEATTPNKYTSRKNSGEFYSNFTCPICNSLKVKFPQISEEWDSLKNGMLCSKLPYASNRYYWWKCKKGHEWKATVASRTYALAKCPQCALSMGDSENGVLMKKVIQYIFNEGKVDVEVPVADTLFRNDCVVQLKNGQRIVFEMQGDFWHYDEKKLVNNNKELYHKDTKKLAVNRAHGDLVFLINEYDFNLGRNAITEELMAFAIKDVLDYVENAQYTVGCDIVYNKRKCQFALRNRQAYYVSLYNQIHQTKYNENLHPKAQGYARFQNMWKVFEEKSEYETRVK